MGAKEDNAGRSEDEDEEDGRGMYQLDERSSLMACKRGLLTLEGLVDAERRSIVIGVYERCLGPHQMYRISKN
jgi:hypothetical protein